jgi:hypothetical protein
MDSHMAGGQLVTLSSEETPDSQGARGRHKGCRKLPVLHLASLSLVVVGGVGAVVMNELRMTEFLLLLILLLTTCLNLGNTN